MRRLQQSIFLFFVTSALTLGSSIVGTWTSPSQGGKATLQIKGDHTYRVSDPKTGPTEYDSGAWTQTGKKVVLKCKPTGGAKNGTPEPMTFTLSADGKTLKPSTPGLPKWTKKGK